MNPEPSSIIAWGEKAERSAFSQEQISKKQMNQWQGWWCTAGKHSLMIEANGQILRAACREGGVFGNVFGSLRYPKTGTYCETPTCPRAEDFLPPKYRYKYLETDYNFKNAIETESEIQSVNVVTPKEWLEKRVIHKRVTWDLGLIASAEGDVFPSADQFLRAAQNIDQFFSHGTKTDFYFSGENLNHYPALAEIEKFLREKGHEVYGLPRSYDVVLVLAPQVIAQQRRSPVAPPPPMELFNSTLRLRVIQFLKPFPKWEARYFSVEYKLTHWRSELRWLFVCAVHSHPAIKNAYYALRHFFVSRFGSKA